MVLNKLKVNSFKRSWAYPLQLSLIVLGMGAVFLAQAEEKTVDLDIDYQMVNFTGQSIKALAVNHQIPGPTLHFKEGDTVNISVHNHLKEGTTIHWHGLILPWNMDGVEGVSQSPIEPGSTFQYHFTLKQSGTYWYHAHAGLQEQEGLYGAIVIDPQTPPSYAYTQDYTIVLSDWINTPAHQVLANLKKGADYYSSKFPLQSSFIQFIKDYRAAPPEGKENLLSAYHMMQHSRMGLYDISDVAYDTFLLNGQTYSHPWTGGVKVGDVVKLRFIGASGSTIFHVKIHEALMELVGVEGHDIRPVERDSLDIAPGETYDVLVKIQNDRPYIIYAESEDGLGAAYGSLITQVDQKVDYMAVKPFPTPQPMMMGNHSMAGMDMGSMSMSPSESHQSMPEMDSKMADMKDMDMSGMQMDDGSEAIDADHNAHSMNHMDPGMMTMPMDHSSPTGMPHPPNGSSSSKEVMETSPGTKYQEFQSLVVTNDPEVPVNAIKMVLSGYMDRYIWFINGVPEYEAKPIMIENGKRYRFIFVNESMMEHPMHLHGHWMILRNGHGAHDPLVHTLNVPPGATIVADFDADTRGQWYFHCHNAFHMMSGMARLFRYSDFDVSTSPEMHHVKMMPSNHSGNSEIPTGHSVHLYQASYFEMGADPFRNQQEGSLKSLIGYDYNKLEVYAQEIEMNKGSLEQANVDVFAWHLVSEFWAIKGGVNYNDRPGETPYWQPGMGFEGLMPYFIDTDARLYWHAGSFKLRFELSRDTQLTTRFFIRVGLQADATTKTVEQDEVGSGFRQMKYAIRPYYQLTPALTFYSEFNYTRDYGQQTTIDRSKGEDTRRATLLFGMSVLF